MHALGILGHILIVKQLKVINDDDWSRIIGNRNIVHLIKQCIEENTHE